MTNFKTLLFAAAYFAASVDGFAVVQLGYEPPFATHATTLLIMSLAFHARNSNSFTAAVNPFLFPDMMPNQTDDAAALARQWDKVLGTDNSRTSFADSTRLFQHARLTRTNQMATA